MEPLPRPRTLLVAPIVALALSLVLAGTARGADTRQVLVFTGNAPASAITKEYTRFGAATNRSIVKSETLGSPSTAGTACVLLPGQTQNFTADQKNTLAGYIGNGGTVIAVGEHSGFSTTNGVMNDLSTQLGAGMTIQNALEDSGFTTTTNIDSHALTAGVAQIRFAATSTLAITAPGASLVKTKTNPAPFIGAATIGTGTFVILADNNVLSDNSENGYSQFDNGTLASNICGGGTGTGTGTGGQTQAGSTGRPTATQVSCTYSFVDFFNRCTAIVADRAGSGSPNPTGIVKFTSASHPLNANCQLQARAPAAGLPSGNSGLSDCQIQYQPPAGSVGNPNITAEYLGSQVHLPSRGSTSLRITGNISGILSNNPALVPPVFPAATSGPAFRSRARKVGTTVRFTLKAPARVRFTVQRKRACGKGKRGSRKSAKRKRKRCKRYRTLRGSFRIDGKAGKNSFRFRGRIGGKTLKPGAYYLAARPQVGNAWGKIRRSRFRIVKR